MNAEQVREVIKDEIIKTMKETELELIRIRKSLEERKLENGITSSYVSFLAHKLQGQIDICDKLGIDRSSFNWIFLL